MSNHSNVQEIRTKMYDHPFRDPNSLRTKELQIVQDMKIQVYKKIERSRTHIEIVDKKKRKCDMVIAHPFDTGVGENERGKLGKYQKLKTQIKIVTFVTINT